MKAYELAHLLLRSPESDVSIQRAYGDLPEAFLETDIAFNNEANAWIMGNQVLLQRMQRAEQALKQAIERLDKVLLLAEEMLRQREQKRP